MIIRSIRDSDWPSILRLETECYSELEPESIEVLQSKWLAAPDYCFVVEKSGHVIAYLLAHPWESRSLPPLYEPLDYNAIDGSQVSRQLFLHDLVVDSRSGGQGIGSSLVNALIRTAESNDMTQIILVAVEGAETFWRKQRFVSILDRPIDSVYGEDAVFMQLELATH